MPAPNLNNAHRGRYHSPADLTKLNEREPSALVDQEQKQNHRPSEDIRFERLYERCRREVGSLLDIQQMALADYRCDEPIPGVLVR